MAGESTGADDRPTATVESHSYLLLWDHLRGGWLALQEVEREHRLCWPGN